MPEMIINTHRKKNMIIIWSGFGFMVALIGCVAGVVGIGTADAILGNSASSAGIGMALGAVLATLGNYALSKWLAPRRQPKIYVDTATAREVRFVKRDTLFFVPVRYWTYVYAFFAACFVVGSAADFIR
jgi:hypothetical protein